MSVWTIIFLTDAFADYFLNSLFSHFVRGRWKNADHNFPQPKVMSSNSPKPQNVKFTIRQRKAENHHVGEAGINDSLTFLLKRWLKWLIDCQKSCQVIVLTITPWTPPWNSWVHHWFTCTCLHVLLLTLSVGFF